MRGLNWEDIKWHDETPRSRWALAVLFLAIIPGLAFYFGIQYERNSTYLQGYNAAKDEELQQALRDSDASDSLPPPPMPTTEVFAYTKYSLDGDNLGETTLFNVEGNVNVQNSYTFTLPKAWKITSASDWGDSKDLTLLSASPNKEEIGIRCPVKPIEFYGWSRESVSSKNRTFMHNGVETYISLTQWKYTPDESDDSSLKESESFEISVDAASGDRDKGCEINANVSPSIRTALEEIYNSWK